MTTPLARPPYYAVIFTSLKSELDDGYGDMADKMLALAAEQDGFLHVDSVRDESGVGITVSYWRDLTAIARWKQQAEHLEAQRLGREKWYSHYNVRICKVEHEYGFEAEKD